MDEVAAVRVGDRPRDLGGVGDAAFVLDLRRVERHTGGELLDAVAAAVAVDTGVIGRNNVARAEAGQGPRFSGEVRLVVCGRAFRQEVDDNVALERFVDVRPTNRRRARSRAGSDRRHADR